MIKSAKSLKSFDQFGALSQIQFFNNDEKFKTIYGGMLSIVIYLLGFTYFLYLMIMWQTYQILPAQTIQSVFNPKTRRYNLNRPLFDFSIEIDESVTEELRSIERKGDLYTLSIYSTDVNGSSNALTPNERKFQCSNVKGKYDYFDPVCMNLNDKFQTGFNSNSQNRSEDTYLDYIIDRCNPLTNVNCLSEQDQSTFFLQPQFYWRLTLFTQDVDLRTGAIINIPQDHYFLNTYNKNASCYLFDLKIRKATFTLDTGRFFANEQTIEVVHSIELTVTQQQFVDPVTQQPAIAYFMISLDRQEEVIRATWPKLGQILAEMGSIFQVLLLAGLMMNKFNYAIMTTKIEGALLKIYFPEITLFKFKFNWRGILKSIHFRRQVLNIQDFESLKQIRQTTVNKLRQKLNYINILHENSRLQIQLQSDHSKKEVIKLQSQGYRMNLPENLRDQISNQDQFLDYQDFVDNIYQKRDKSKTSIYKIDVEDVENSNDTPETPLGITPPYQSKSLQSKSKRQNLSTEIQKVK